MSQKSGLFIDSYLNDPLTIWRPLTCSHHKHQLSFHDSQDENWFILILFSPIVSVIRSKYNSVILEVSCLYVWRSLDVSKCWAGTGPRSLMKVWLFKLFLLCGLKSGERRRPLSARRRILIQLKRCLREPALTVLTQKMVKKMVTGVVFNFERECFLIPQSGNLPVSKTHDTSTLQ